MIPYNGRLVWAVEQTQFSKLRKQLEKSAEYIALCDSNNAVYQSRVDSLKQSNRDYSDALIALNIIIRNVNEEVDKEKQICKNQKKIWLRRFIYGSSGGLAVGLVAGVIIMK